MAAEDPRDAIERAARAHRAAAEASAKGAGGESASGRARAEREVRQGVLEVSLGGGKGGDTLVAIAIGVCLCGSIAFFAVVLPRYTDQTLLCVVGGTVVALGSAFGAAIVTTSWIAAARTRSVRAIGHGLDVGAYLERMSEKRRRGRLAVTVHFDRAWDAELRDTLPDAILGWLPELAVARWDGDRALRLESAELSTTDTYTGGTHGRSHKVFTNYPLHACMMKIAKTIVPKVGAVQKVARLEADVVGEVCPIEEDA